MHICRKFANLPIRRGCTTLMTISCSDLHCLAQHTDDDGTTVAGDRVDVNVDSMDVRTLLAVAVKCNQIFMARLLIVAGGIDVNKPFASGKMVLEMPFKWGSNIDVMNVRGHKVIDMAVRYGYVAVTELLLECGDISENGMTE